MRMNQCILKLTMQAAWKNEGCPEGVFEVPPMDKGSAQERADLWKRRLAPTRRFRFNVGTMALSDMWRGGYSGIDQLRHWKRYDPSQLEILSR
jgi:THO complex subunit 1